MVRTSSNISVRWGREPSYGTAPDPVPRWMGLDAKPKFMINGNPMPLYDIGQKEPESFAEGKLELTCDISSTLSTPWPLSMIWDREVTSPAASGSGDAQVYTHKWAVKPIPPTATIQVLFDGEDGDVNLKMLGCVAQSLKISSQIGQYVQQDIGWKCGRVGTIGDSLAAFTDPAGKHPVRTNEPDFPYTFKFGEVYLGANKLAEVESFSLDCQTGSDLQYDHGLKESTSAYDGQFRYNGQLKYAMKDKTVLERVRDVTSNSTLRFIFDNDITQSASKNAESIELLFSQVVFPTNAFQAQGIERIFNDTTFIAGKATITVKNKYATRQG